MASYLSLRKEKMGRKRNQSDEIREEDIQDEKKIAKKRHWKIYLFSFFIIFAVAGAVLVYRFAQKPAQGTVKPQAQAVGEDKPQNTLQQFSGKYLSFKYQSSYTLKSHDVDPDKNKIILEEAYLSDAAATSQKIILTVRSLPSHNLEDDPDYKMREINTKRYWKESFSEGAVSGLVFVPADNSSFEKSFFILHGDFLAIISITAPAPPDGTLNQEADAIVASVTWLQ